MLITDIEAAYIPLILLIMKIYIKKKFSKGLINYDKSFKTISFASFTIDESLEVSGDISG